MAASAIEWTDEVWNPVSGCTRVSAGCDFCYAVEMTRWLSNMSSTADRYGGLVNDGKDHFNGITRTHPDTLSIPLGWRKPRRVFVNSMSDLFHPDIPASFIADVFDVMRRADRHAFQVLTKRPERAAKLAPELPWPPNVLMGTSVEEALVMDRVDALRQIPAHIRFVSTEPLIGSLAGINLDGIDWVIAGGESGRHARRMDPDWARELRDACVDSGTAFFFKQWGRFNAEGEAVGKKHSGRLLDGETWDEHPPVPGFASPYARGLAVPPPLDDESWSRVRSVVPGREGTPGGRALDNRTFLDAVRWKAWTGAPWRELPTRLGKWNTVSVRAKRLARGGHWPAICDQLDDRLVERFVGGH